MDSVNVLTTPPARPVSAVAFQRIPPGGTVTIGAAGVVKAVRAPSGQLDMEPGGMFGGLDDAGIDEDFLIDPMVRLRLGYTCATLVMGCFGYTCVMGCFGYTCYGGV